MLLRPLSLPRLPSKSVGAVAEKKEEEEEVAAGGPHSPGGAALAATYLVAKESTKHRVKQTNTHDKFDKKVSNQSSGLPYYYCLAKMLCSSWVFLIMFI